MWPAAKRILLATGPQIRQLTGSGCIIHASPYDSDVVARKADWPGSSIMSSVSAFDGPIGNELLSLLGRRFITPHHAALMRLVTGCEQRFETSRETGDPARVFQTSFEKYAAFVEHEHDASSGRVDVHYTNKIGTIATIRSLLTQGIGFRINFVFAHVVIHDGEVAAWWLLQRLGNVRVTPLDPIGMAKTLTDGLADNIDPLKLRPKGMKLLGLTAEEALSIAGSPPATVNLGQALCDGIEGTTDYRNALARHVAVMMHCALKKQGEFDELIATSRDTGRAISAASLESCCLVPGYFVVAQFTRTPGKFTIYYSGDDGAPCGMNQGAIQFHDYRLTTWWYISSARRIKFV
jgi:hypothetical protein